MAETIKSRLGRIKADWFNRYAPSDAKGIDIGCDNDPLYRNQHWDSWELKPNGDATFMDGVPNEKYEVVYSSHCLEHIADPVTALKNWWRILKPGGNLIVCVPHRDLYEKKKSLPSLWNPEHKWFWLPDRGEEPITLSLLGVLRLAAPSGELLSLRVQDRGWKPVAWDKHSSGEYSIEIVFRKPIPEWYQGVQAMQQSIQNTGGV